MQEVTMMSTPVQLCADKNGLFIFFRQEKTINEANWSEQTNRKMQDKLYKVLLCEINNGQSVDIVFAS